MFCFHETKVIGNAQVHLRTVMFVKNSSCCNTSPCDQSWSRAFSELKAFIFEPRDVGLLLRAHIV